MMKKIEMLFLCVLFLLFSSQCQGSNRETYGCKVDADCMNSCALGAVNTSWYAMHAKNDTCMDGCAGQAASAPRCINQFCTAFQFGQYDASCTKGPKPKDSILLELTKYSCSSDFDCVMSCGQGAVNQTWYKKSGGSKSDCVDGCAADGFDSKCENHICEAYLEGKKYPGCTRK